MTSIRRCELPEDALLRRYLLDGGYVDCYAAEIPRSVDHADYIEAFYTTSLFKLERALLAWLIDRPSLDRQARALARGELASFAAWTVEARESNQLLLCDLYGRTRSWMMSVPARSGAATRLLFGSAVVPVTNRRTGRSEMDLRFRALLGFHKLYSRALLLTAAARVTRLRR